jgi:hypothetical protein
MTAYVLLIYLVRHVKLQRPVSVSAESQEEELSVFARPRSLAKGKRRSVELEFSYQGMEAPGTSLGGLQLPMTLLDGVEASSSSSSPSSADNLLADLVPAIHKLAAKVRANADASANADIGTNTSVSVNHGNVRGGACGDIHGDFEQQLCGLVQHMEVRLYSYTSPLSPCTCYYPRTR